jgi:hypothetical protein
MKIDEVPQDADNFKDRDKVKKIVYAIDKSGNYTKENSAGWDIEIAATKQAWAYVEDEISEVIAEVKKGIASPIKYYMTKQMLELGVLAKYVGKWKWQIKKHLTMKGFLALSPQMLEKYAKAFGITLEELFEPNFDIEK